jgi:hypothetical protein
MADFNPFDREAKTEVRTAEQKREREQQLADTLFVMADPAGRRFMHRLLSRAGLYRSSFDVDPHRTSFNEGERNIGLFLMAEIMQVAAHQYAEMLEEQRNAS